MVEIHILNVTSTIQGLTPVHETHLDTALSYFMDGAYFSPKYRRNQWDGRKHLYKWSNPKTPFGKFPTGLVSRVIQTLETVEPGIPLTVIDDRIKPQLGPLLPLAAGVQLYDYQEDAITSAIAATRGIYRLPTGSGKSLAMAGLIARLNLPTMVFSHRVDILKHLKAELEQGLGQEVGIIQGTTKDLKKFNVAMIQTVMNCLDNDAVDEESHKVSEFVKDYCQLLIVDECFAAGTLIDGKPIERIKCGDMVRSYNHLYDRMEMREVVRTYKSKPKTLCKVRIGTLELICTWGHPFFVQGKGYVQARNLNRGDMLLVQNEIYSHETMAKIPYDGGQAYLLLKNMFLGIQSKALVGDNGENESPVRVGSNEGTKPDEAQGNQRQDERVFNSDWTQACGSWGQWYGSNSAAAVIVRQNNIGMSRDGIRCADGYDARNWVPISLQNRYCVSHSQAGGRGGRALTFGSAENKRRKERRFSEITRVDGVETFEPDHSGSYGGILADGFVYNLEVEGNHNYFANNILVHNCHHISSDSFTLLTNRAYNSFYRIGMSATPTRGEASDMLVEASLGRLQMSVTPSHLIRDKRLAKPYIFFVDYGDKGVKKTTVDECHDCGSVNLIQVDKPMRGELDRTVFVCQICKKEWTTYQDDVVRNLVNNDKRNEAIVQLAAQEMRRGRSVLIAVTYVAHGQLLEQMMTKRVDPALVKFVYSETEDRSGLLAKLDSKEVMCLVVTTIFGEGVNIKSLDTLINAKGADSAIDTIQVVGRALRRTDKKRKAVIIDFQDTSRYLSKRSKHRFELLSEEPEFVVKKITRRFFKDGNENLSRVRGVKA